MADMWLVNMFQALGKLQKFMMQYCDCDCDILNVGFMMMMIFMADMW